VFDAHLTRQQRIRYYVRGPEWGFAIPQGDLAALDDVMERCSATTCPECNTHFFVALDQLDETISCFACRREFVLPTSRSAQELPLRYQLDGLMARVMDQDVIPVLLTCERCDDRAVIPTCFLPGRGWSSLA
jgi:hypothetical protein